jgi:hypothetical protein
MSIIELDIKYLLHKSNGNFEQKIKFVSFFLMECKKNIYLCANKM